MKRLAVPGIVAALLTVTSPPCLALEGGVGRSFIGAQITPYIGIIPPDPGFQYSFNYIHLDGSIGGNKQVPIAGEVALVFLTAVLTTGPLWGKPIWGTWWTWDARLTLTLFLWFLTAGYLVLRGAVDDPSMRARYSAVNTGRNTSR